MNGAYLLDWANLLLRWAHVLFAIAWIGSSLYFVWLDNHLVAPTDEALQAKGVDGELWAVHGGGFYNPQKYLVGPKQMPGGTLHWFYWESYSTWLSGFALFALLYLFNAPTYLIDARIHEWPSATQAVGAALGFLVAGWLAYDAICRFAPSRLVSPLVSLFIVLASTIACALFAGRAAFVLVGAMLATLMSANVLLWIIPGQRKVVGALQAGQAPNPIHGQRGKQRSVHNTYLAPPVLVAMLSNHYPALYAHRYNALLLLGLMLAGALARRVFVLRHKGPIRWPLVAACVVLLGLLVVLAAPRGGTSSVTGPVPKFAQVQAIVQQRCVACHNAQLANKGVRLDSAGAIRSRAPQLVQQAVLQQTMPLNNATAMTEQERALIGRWWQAGAP
jgi:uncharacterized membrane protein